MGDETPGRPSDEYVEWLESQSMLFQAAVIFKSASDEASLGTKQWSYSKPQTDRLIDLCDCWLAAYPPSIITAPGESILTAMADRELLKMLSDIGIYGLHTGPIKKAGGVIPGKKEFTPTCDGWFDRISFDVDPAFGSSADLSDLVRVTAEHNISVLGDIVPGHSGTGPDFLLALLNYKNYSSMYSIVPIDQSHWSLLPPVPGNEISANISFEVADKLFDLGYFPGHPQRCIFSVPGEPPKTCFDVTGPITGVDGILRRWVFLHYFKPGQPSFDWLDPNSGPGRIQAADILRSLKEGFRVLRLDASPFLGLEKTEEHTVQSEAGPIALHVSETLSWSIRKNGGFSFQEIVHDIDHIKEFSISGADLTYDFILRPAYQHALLIGDASFLKTMINEMILYGIDPKGLIHALQTHDEVTYELVHLISHSKDNFDFRNEKVKGRELRDLLLGEVLSKLSTARTPFIKFSGNGVCTTMVGWIAAGLNVRNPLKMTSEQKDLVQRGHFLFAAFNALQPGVFALSSWDLVGAFPLSSYSIASLAEKDGDWRWVNRGAVDLGGNRHGPLSHLDIPRAKSLYGSLREQLSSPFSFSSQLKELLRFRASCGIAKGSLVALLETHPSVTALLYSLPPSSENMKALLENTRGHFLLVVTNWSLDTQYVQLSHPSLQTSALRASFPFREELRSDLTEK